MRPKSRRQFLAKLTGVAAGSRLVTGRSRPTCGYPEHLRWIVPNTAGGGYDSYSRLLHPFLERELGVDIRIDNQPGVGGLRGARLISRAPPDGGTLGIMNAPAALMTQFTGDDSMDPIEGFTSLGTIARANYVWATGVSSRIRSVRDMIRLQRSSSLVFGVNTLRDLGFLLPSLTTSMLGWSAGFVSGYRDSADRAMAAIRGEVDIVSLSWEVLVDRIEAGDLRPVLSMSPDVTALHPAFEGLPSVTGPNGLITRLAPEFADTVESLVRLMGAGRVLVAPPGLPAELAACLRDGVCRSLKDPALMAAAAARELSVEPLCADATTNRMRIARDDVSRLAPLVRAAVERER